MISYYTYWSSILYITTDTIKTYLLWSSGYFQSWIFYGVRQNDTLKMVWNSRIIDVVIHLEDIQIVIISSNTVWLQLISRSWMKTHHQNWTVINLRTILKLNYFDKSSMKSKVRNFKCTQIFVNQQYPASSICFEWWLSA